MSDDEEVLKPDLIGNPDLEGYFEVKTFKPLSFATKQTRIRVWQIQRWITDKDEPTPESFVIERARRRFHVSEATARKLYHIAVAELKWNELSAFKRSLKE